MSVRPTEGPALLAPSTEPSPHGGLPEQPGRGQAGGRAGGLGAEPSSPGPSGRKQLAPAPDPAPLWPPGLACCGAGRVCLAVTPSLGWVSCFAGSRPSRAPGLRPGPWPRRGGFGKRHRRRPLWWAMAGPAPCPPWLEMQLTGSPSGRGPNPYPGGGPPLHPSHPQPAAAQPFLCTPTSGPEARPGCPEAPAEVAPTGPLEPVPSSSRAPPLSVGDGPPHTPSLWSPSVVPPTGEQQYLEATPLCFFVAGLHRSPGLGLWVRGRLSDGVPLEAVFTEPQEPTLRGSPEPLSVGPRGPLAGGLARATAGRTLQPPPPGAEQGGRAAGQTGRAGPSRGWIRQLRRLGVASVRAEGGAWRAARGWRCHGRLTRVSDGPVLGAVRTQSP